MLLGDKAVHSRHWRRVNKLVIMMFFTCMAAGYMNWDAGRSVAIVDPVWILLDASGRLCLFLCAFASATSSFAVCGLFAFLSVCVCVTVSVPVFVFVPVVCVSMFVRVCCVCEWRKVRAGHSVRVMLACLRTQSWACHAVQALTSQQKLKRIQSELRVLFCAATLRNSECGRRRETWAFAPRFGCGFACCPFEQALS